MIENLRSRRPNTQSINYPAHSFKNRLNMWHGSVSFAFFCHPTLVVSRFWIRWLSFTSRLEIFYYFLPRCNFCRSFCETLRINGLHFIQCFSPRDSRWSHVESNVIPLACFLTPFTFMFLMFHLCSIFSFCAQFTKNMKLVTRRRIVEEQFLLVSISDHILQNNIWMMYF